MPVCPNQHASNGALVACPSVAVLPNLPKFATKRGRTLSTSFAPTGFATGQIWVGSDGASGNRLLAQILEQSVPPLAYFFFRPFSTVSLYFRRGSVQCAGIEALLHCKTRGKNGIVRQATLGTTFLLVKINSLVFKRISVFRTV